AERRGLDAMFARDGLYRGEPLLDPLLSLRIRFEVGLVTLRRLDALAQRDETLIDGLRDRGEARIELGQRARHRQRARNRVLGIQIFRFPQQLQDLART